MLWEKMTLWLRSYLVPGALSGGFLKPRSSYGLLCISGWFRKIGRVCLRWGWGEDIVKISSGGHWEGHGSQQCGILTFISNLHGLVWNKMAGQGPLPEGEEKRSPQVATGGEQSHKQCFSTGEIPLFYGKCSTSSVYYIWQCARISALKKICKRNQVI